MMLNAKQWMYFIVATLVLAIMFAIADIIFAGILYIVIVLFDASAAGIVFKWLIVSLLLIEIPITIPYLYKTAKDERNEKSGT